MKERNYNENGIYLFVVNKDITKNANVGISLNKEYKIFWFDKNNGSKKFIREDTTINADILSGSGEFFYCE